MVSVGLSYFNTLESIQNALIADEIALREQRIAQLEEELEKEMAKKHADEDRIERLKKEIELEKQHIENLRQSAALTVEQTVSQKRLVAIQQTAMQLAMMGANDAADLFAGTAVELTKALEDGNVTEQEMKDILEKLGVTFDETGKPVINLKNIMEEFRQKLEETRNKVHDLRSALGLLDGLTIHTYHYHHEIIVRGEEHPPVPEGGGRGWPEYWYGGGPPPAQHGAWFTREGLYYLHRGEMVLPRRVAEWFRRGGFAARNIVVNVNIHASASSPQDWDEVARIISRKIVSNLRVMA